MTEAGVTGIRTMHVGGYATRSVDHVDECYESSGISEGVCERMSVGDLSECADVCVRE